MNIAGSGSESVSQRYGSADPDPQDCLPGIRLALTLMAGSFLPCIVAGL
jgi:hypothetical protein